MEPTVVAALALHVFSRQESDERLTEAISEATEKVADLQHHDGSLGVSESIPSPHWTTAWGTILWSGTATHPTSRVKAIAWLESHQGNTDLLSTGGPFSHNSTIPGWPWVLGTQSWLEPTALSVMAFAAAGQSDHPRARQGRELILDRAIRTGGWNYGNSQVFGADLRAQPVSTGLAILALTSGAERDLPCIERGCDFLERALPGTRAPQSLSWGLLGLTACNRRPADAAQWLIESFEKVAARPDPAFPTATLLLASSPATLHLFGLDRGGQETP